MFENLTIPKAEVILWQDQAEYYFVCKNCYAILFDGQWSGSTRSYGNWRGRAQEELKEAIAANRYCECCGPQGNGGWSLYGGNFPCAEIRDKRAAARDQIIEADPVAAALTQEAVNGWHASDYVRKGKFTWQQAKSVMAELIVEGQSGERIALWSSLTDEGCHHLIDYVYDHVHKLPEWFTDWS